MIRILLAPAVMALALQMAAGSAQAQTAQRAWVSGHGTDAAGCGAPTAPCRSLQYAHDNIVAAGGEIDVLDPAGYGSLVISKAISIINDGVGTAGVQATSGNAITINAAASDAIRLRGLSIEGLGAATNGVLFNTGGSLELEDSTVSGFTGSQVLFQPTGFAQLVVSNVRVAHSAAGNGIYVQPRVASGSGHVAASLERIDATNLAVGVFADGRQSGANVVTLVTLDDSLVAHDAIGVEAQRNGTGVVIRNATISDNGAGLSSPDTDIFFSRSTFAGNTTLFANSIGGLYATYGDNVVVANSNAGASPTPFPLQ